MVALSRDDADGESARGRAHFGGGSARALSLAPRRTGRARECAARSGESARATTSAAREIVTYIIDRNINYTNVCNVYCKFCAFYRTEKDDDHYVLSREQLDQKLDELSAAGGVQILMQGGHHPKLVVRLVSRSAPAHPRKISAHQYPRIQPAGVPAFRAALRDAAARSDLAIQRGRARLDSGRRRRNSGRSRARTDLAAEMQFRRVARSDADRRTSSA